jgi:general stress protein 26
MPTPAELEAKFWSSVRSDMTMMVGLSEENGHHRPLTAQIDGDGNHGPIWFFTSTDTDFAQALAKGVRRTSATFVSKGHDLFACVHGTAEIDNDRAVIDRLWNSFVAAWYEGGKDDPKLALVRFDTVEGEVWENASNILASLKMLFGIKPQESYRDNVAKVQLD